MSSNPFVPPGAPNIDPIGKPSQDDRNLALIAHLSGCVGIVAGGLIGFVGPLIIYLMQKDSSSYAATQAKEALNFQITLFLLTIASVLITLTSCGFAFPIIFVPMVLQLVFGIVAALAVRDGTDYRYPFNLRLIQ